MLQAYKMTRHCQRNIKNIHCPNHWRTGGRGHCAMDSPSHPKNEKNIKQNQAVFEGLACHGLPSDHKNEKI